jgi:hypothetical protein
MSEQPFYKKCILAVFYNHVITKLFVPKYTGIFMR